MFLWGRDREEVDKSINKLSGHNDQGGEEINREMRERWGPFGQGGQEVLKEVTFERRAT